MARTLIFIRHAETDANAQRRWQGELDSHLSDVGRRQVELLGRRTAEWKPGAVLSSDKRRTIETARAIGEPEMDPRWREFAIGVWEGKLTEEVHREYPGAFEAWLAGEDVGVEGLEPMADFHARIGDAMQGAFDRMDDGDETVVVTHGGVIWSVLGHVLDNDGTGVPATLAHNTSITRVRALDDGSLQVAVFNDATHLADVPDHFGPDGTAVTLIRHGRTEGNATHRWQGRSDSPLTDEGRGHAATAGRLVSSFDALYTSPLGRASDTASIFAAANGHPDPVAHDGLIEMSFGDWENLTAAEAEFQDPELYRTIYVEQRDEPRGRTGESFTQAGERMSVALADIAAKPGREIAAVSHGAAIRSYAVSVLGLGFDKRNTLPIPRNTSMSRMVYTSDASLLASYNVAPHLD